MLETYEQLEFIRQVNLAHERISNELTKQSSTIRYVHREIQPSHHVQYMIFDIQWEALSSALIHCFQEEDNVVVKRSAIRRLEEKLDHLKKCIKSS